jgi:hypothetical protein
MDSLCSGPSRKSAANVYLSRLEMPPPFQIERSVGRRSAWGETGPGGPYAARNDAYDHDKPHIGGPAAAYQSWQRAGPI